MSGAADRGTPLIPWKPADLQRLVNKIPFLRNRLDSHMREVVSGASIAFVLKVASAGLAFLFNILLARLLGAEGAGTYFIALTITTAGTVIGRLGLNNTLLRLTASNAVVNDWAAVLGITRKGISLSLGISAAVALAILLSASWVAGSVLSKPELVGPIRWMALAVIPMSMLTLHSEMLKGLKRIRDSQMVSGLILWGLLLPGLFFLGRVWGLNGAIWAYILASAITAVVGRLLWRRAIRPIQVPGKSVKTGLLLKSSMPLFWVEVMTMFINWSGIFMLGIWGSKADVGIFGAASRMTMLISFILLAANSIVAPKFAALFKQGDMAALGTTARSTALLVTVLASPILLFLIFCPSWVMGLFGEQFRQGAVVLSILAVGQFINVATGSVGYLLMMSGNEKLLRNNIVIIGVLNFVLNILLIPRMGITGAAIVTASCVALQNLIASYLVYNAINISILPLPKFMK